MSPEGFALGLIRGVRVLGGPPGDDEGPGPDRKRTRPVRCTTYRAGRRETPESWPGGGGGAEGTRETGRCDSMTSTYLHRGEDDVSETCVTRKTDRRGERPFKDEEDVTDRKH